MSDRRRERIIRNNRIRRQKEMRKNIILIIMTICLVITFSLSLNSFLSDAKEDGGKTYNKCYKSITISNDDTLWSIAKEYMDDEHYDSVNDYIKEVKKINELSTNNITYGAHLIVPYYVYKE